MRLQIGIMKIRPTKVIVDLKVLANNIRTLNDRLAASTLFMAVVKADAYGHGIVPAAKTAIAECADWLGVALVEEGIKLRESGIQAPILVFGEVAPNGASLVVQNNIAAMVCSIESLHALNQAAEISGRQAVIHIKVDTGMGRIGLNPNNVLPFFEKVASFKNVRIEGLFSHFASADEKDKRFSYYQLDRFHNIIASLNARGIKIPLKHIAGSAATIDLPESHFDMARLGISLYGIYPSTEVDHSISLKPAMTLKTEITFLKDVPKGVPISYGRTFVTRRRSRIATLPIGYADGYPRLLSNQGEVLVFGKRVPLIGRVCMDMTMIDVTDIPQAQIGSEVVLFGRQNGAEIFVDEIAQKIGTISHEIICGITRRVPRQYLHLTP